MVVRILGPLEVICGGRGVPIRGGKERALVVRLALGSGRAVSPQLLVASLVGRGAARVSGRIGAGADFRVRKALAAVGADDIIRTRPPGYVLSVDEIDAVRFDVLSARGRGELADGRPDLAASTLTEALALWRGDTLAEVGSEYLRVEAVRLTRPDWRFWRTGSRPIWRADDTRACTPSWRRCAGPTRCGKGCGRCGSRRCTGVLGRPRRWPRITS